GTQVQEISGTVGWAQVTTNVTSGSHTFKWEYSKDGSVTTGADTGWIDNIIFPPSVTYDNDLAGMSVSGNQSVNVGSTESYEVLVKNAGNNSQNEYTVKLFKSGGVELASLDVTDTIAPDQIVAHDLSWAIPSNEPTGPTTIYGQVILAGDENSNNDFTSDFNVMVYPEGLVIILDEGFEGGSLPAGWSQEYMVGDNDWIYQNGGQLGNPGSAHTGSYNAAFLHTISGNSTKLITPEINLGTANDGVLTFWHAQANWATDQDELHVYYKNSSGGAWILIESFIEDTPAWTERIIFLPNPSTTYYVAFEGLDDYGYGVCLDDILITGDPTVYDNDLAGQVISGNTIVNAGNTEAYSIEVKNVGNNSQNNYTVKLFK
ncbi:MAG: choice-of-anchor J domain-containing protein, partial [Candidatus Delongbacteria bacterium]|nr:choice-of-anchor J domain-containing protein [Candidatus Delongbacteria bacterium]